MTAAQCWRMTTLPPSERVPAPALHGGYTRPYASISAMNRWNACTPVSRVGEYLPAR